MLDLARLAAVSVVLVIPGTVFVLPASRMAGPASQSELVEGFDSQSSLRADDCRPGGFGRTPIFPENTASLALH